ncbi:preprotein translocase subunit YajC [Tamaricihabitans halophyticus]|uniref:Preprotein translocase subunit YajC n=1 Tax=Tamaricihabitans halophyticus TaxID=1262583 RepID=A0A4R2QDJ2_9PSEU|nr:preprotein translocase subunit YajC [Tamaricihabitans halophyticus]TCP46308.1 preprotein translocase subunit YajC [Tamaricihabitans halophyticus]
MESFFLPLLLLVLAIPLFLGARKQKRAVQQQQELQTSLSVGDRVMTTSGLYATVADVSDDVTIELEIADGVQTTWLRQAVREKVNPVVDTDETDSDDELVESDASSLEVDASADDKPTEAQVAPPLEHGKTKN